METRKVQLTGGSTFTVSLPNEWATEIDLETGDTLRLYHRDRVFYDYQTTARQLERVGDHAEKIATLASQFESAPPEDFVDEIETAAATSREIVEQASGTIIGDIGIETAHSALDSQDELAATLEALGRETSRTGCL